MTTQKMRLIPYEALAHEKGVIYSAEHLRRLERAGKFPKRMPGSRRLWVETEIDDWIRKQIELRDNHGSEHE